MEVKDKKAHLDRGRLLSVHGKFKEAIKEYERALEIDPDYEEARTNLGLIHFLLYQQKEEGGD